MTHVAQSTDSRRRHFVAIVNPVSGRRNMLPIVQQIQRRLAREGAGMELNLTRHAGHAVELASRMGDHSAAVLVVGGDGTVCEVVNGFGGRPVPLLVLRTGTENLLARELNMPVAVEAVARTLLHGSVFHADVGLINGNRHFLAVAGVGFDAECVVRMARVRRGHITHGDYFWPIWRTCWAHRFPALTVWADGEEIFRGRGFAILGVIPRYSVGLRLLPCARIDDGLLDVAVFPCASRVQLLAHAARAFSRCFTGAGGVIYRQFRELRVESPEQVPVETDGEFAGHLPMVCRVQPRAAAYLLADRTGGAATKGATISSRLSTRSP